MDPEVSPGNSLDSRTILSQP